MAENASGPDDGMSPEEYERLVVLAAKRRRGEPSDELEDWVRADPAAAEMVELQDNVARRVRDHLAAIAPSAEHTALQKASFLAEVERRSRTRRLRWAAGLAVAASLAVAVPLLLLCWRPTVVGRATVTGLHQARQVRVFDVRAGQIIRADTGSRIQIDLGGSQVIELRPRASVSAYDDRTVVFNGQVNGTSGSLAMRIDVAERSILLEPGTRFRIALADQRCTLWTDREAKLVQGSKERTLVAGETTTLDLNGSVGP